MSRARPAGRWRRRRGALAVTLLVTAATLAVAAARRPVDLTEVLLVLLVEVVAVSLMAGRTVAAATAVGVVMAVNWLLVPPYGTLAVAQVENWLTLAVFLAMAVGVSSLVEAVLGSEAEVASAAAREAALADALRPDEAPAEEALHVLLAALQLDAVALVDPQGQDVLLAGADRLPGADPTLRVRVAPGFEVLGWGADLIGARPEYTTTLATAAVRAWESERLVREQERSARLAEVDAARAALLASIGHDLRTPLAGIRLSADALAMAGPELPEADRAELIEGLRQSAVRLDGLLDAVLETARLEAGAQASAPVPIDLRDVVGDTLVDLASSRLRTRLPAEPVAGVVDPTLCGRILANLVANALAHTPEDRPVEVACAGPAGAGGPATIVVADHGPGLVTGAVDRGPNRAGLGLVIVERLARFAQVGVRTTDTPGGGLTVTLDVPTQR